MVLREEGIVVRLDEDNSVWVEAVRSSSCEGCASKEACLSKQGGTMEAHAQNDAGARVGDRVLMEIPHRSFITVTMLIYIFPVIALIVGAFTGQYFAEAWGIDVQAASVMAGFGFFIVSVLAVVVAGRIVGKNKRYLPKVTRIL